MKNVASTFCVGTALFFLFMAFIEHTVFKDTTGTFFDFIGAIMIACTSIILTQIDEFARTVQ